jgi:hypothetical protein
MRREILIISFQIPKGVKAIPVHLFLKDQKEVRSLTQDNMWIIKAKEK